MPKKDKLGILDLETLDNNLAKSATMGQLQWVWKLIKEKQIKQFDLRVPEDEKAKADFDRTWEQYLAFGSAQRLNEDDDYTLEDVERSMRHFIKAYDTRFMAEGIKDLERGKYELDDEVAHYIKESFLRYLDSTQKKGELDKAFKTVKKVVLKNHSLVPYQDISLK